MIASFFVRRILLAALTLLLEGSIDGEHIVDPFARISALLIRNLLLDGVRNGSSALWAWANLGDAGGSSLDVSRVELLKVCLALGLGVLFDLIHSDLVLGVGSGKESSNSKSGSHSCFLQIKN